MRTNSDLFDEFNQASRRDLRLVIVVHYPTPWVLTSHSGIPNIPAGALEDVLIGVSSTSQRLNPGAGSSEIGAMSFDTVDAGNAVTTRIRTELAAGEGLKGRKVELYRGGASMDWSDFRVEQTQQIEKDVVLNMGAYKFQCSDIQRSMRKDLFDLATTRLSAQLDAGDTTVDVFDTSAFTACSHTASFGDETSGSWYYFKIKYRNGFEIVKASGKTATSFTGCTRGMFGTNDITHVLPSGSDADSGIEIEEYPYLELPFPALIYALLTGDIIGGGTIPWHLGISTADVPQASFENIGEDWFDSSDYAKGLIFRFQNLSKTDGKRFIEKECCLLAGAFLRVGADGKLYLKRMTGVVESSDYVLELNPDNAIQHGPLKHNLTQVKNNFDVEWSYVHFSGESKPRFARRNVLLDATSIGVHGQSKPLALQFKGLHNERHTYTTLGNRFAAHRDRFAAPPIELPVDLLPSMNDLEIGDIVRARFPNVQDYTAAGSLDRSCEIQQIRVNQVTGRVTAQLFASTSKAEPIADSGAGANSELPDSWYSSTGTEMGTLLTIDGSGILQADGTLTGGTTTRTIFYFLGDFTIPSGRTLTITGNAELRIRGHLDISGMLEATTGRAANTAGYIGTTFGGRGLLTGNGGPYITPAVRVIGENSAMPVLEIENNSGVLEGIPADMRGSGGGTGGDLMDWEVDEYLEAASGGAGGIGGGSVVTVSRGASYGVSGETVVSGANGNAGGTFGGEEAGSGGGGAPGCVLHMLDGSQVTFPILAGNVVGLYGTSPETGSNPDTPGKATATDPVDLGVAVGRVAYVPASRDPYPEYENIELGPQDGGDGISAVPSFTPGMIGGDSNFVYTLNMLNGATPNDGEIRVQGSTFQHPDGTTVSLAASDIAIYTAYEGATVGKFYIMYSAVNAETRFGGVLNDWGAGSDSRFLTVVHDDTNGWRARSNGSDYYAFTPLATDCIIAVCEKVATSGGVETIVSLTAGIAGADGSDGAAGADALVSYLTNESHVVAADNAGENYSLTASGGTHRLFEGTTERTASATHSVVGSATKNGLTISVVAGTGVFSLSGASWTSDVETFTLRATYNSVNYDKVYTIAKAKAGGSGPTGAPVQLDGDNLAHLGIGGANGTVSYRLNMTTGKEQSREGSGSYGDIGDFLLSGAVADYEYMLEDLGTGNSTPTGDSLDTWHDHTSDRTWTLTQTSTGAPDTFNGTAKIRHKVTQTIHATGSVIMSASKEP